MTVAETSIPAIEPRRLRVERRLNVTPAQAMLARVSGVVAALAVAAVVLTLTGRDPVNLLWKAVDGTFLEVQEWRSWACSSHRSS